MNILELPDTIPPLISDRYSVKSKHSYIFQDVNESYEKIKNLMTERKPTINITYDDVENVNTKENFGGRDTEFGVGRASVSYDELQFHEPDAKN